MDGYFDGITGFWAFLFLLSKIAELGDTVFLVLRKRPVIFLNWFHHVSVLIWMWVAYPSRCAAMRWGIGMNYAVHSIMYTYFTLRALEVRLPRWIATGITTLQMSQFVVAIGITGDVLARILGGDTGCENPRGVIVGQSALYCLYLALFAHFFVRSYCQKPKPTRQKGE